MKFLMTIPALLFTVLAFAQSANTPFIKLVQPANGQNNVRSSKQFIVGRTCKSCGLSINGEPVKVYLTGGFAYELSLKPGDTSFTLVAFFPPDKTSTKTISYNYTIPPAPEPVKTLDIASIETFPEGNLYVMPGDRIKFKVKALPGSTVMANGKIPLYEMPNNKMPGIYQGEYVVKETDSFLVSKIPVSLTDSAGNTISKQSKYWLSMFSPQMPNVAVTKGRLAHLLFGLGDDRLGGAKIGYIDSMIQLKVVGKVGSDYKVQLSKYRTAYIPDDLVEFLPRGTFTPESLTGKWTVYGDDVYDYVQLGLSARLPYQGFQQVDPAKIIVDVFGATNNTNWITQLENTKEIKNVSYEQIEDEVFRITIELKHAQHWGYSIYYKGNILVVQVKRQPENLSLNNLTIAVDAGHGGTNSGAGGPTGSSEKMLTLAVSLKLQKALQQAGAKVIMTRSTEKFVDNKERILFYRDSVPDILVSVHLNSSADPIHVAGTATFYRHAGFRSINNSIYKRLLELGLKEYGNNSSFNFMLNSPTEYPNVLVETLFLSNPEEEMKILNEKFQQQVADKIVLGIKDFLESCKKGK
ncbi:MAG: N-acetylmuramoyl-L-alanine amidase [Chitinophagaceae bacterium]|nr:N-acetylmuramoyl-L-alanine amidase [Chitinophagaceae bacterium]